MSSVNVATWFQREFILLQKGEKQIIQLSTFLFSGGNYLKITQMA